MSLKILWEKSRACKANKQLVETGKQQRAKGVIHWSIRKSAAKVAFQLYLNGTESPMATYPTIRECKEYAEDFL
jgi:hypothetical protein